MFGNNNVNNESFAIIEEPRFNAGLAPRLWLAVAAPNGVGVRGRYFHLDQEASESAENASNNVVNATDFLLTHLKMRVADMELTCQRQAGPWTLLASGGVRYAHLRRNSLLLEDNQGSDFGSSRQVDFEAYGPTLAVEGRGSIGGGLSAYAMLRGSLLAGTTDNRLQSGQFNNGFEAALTNFSINITETNDSLLVGELQVGLEWAKKIRCSEVFARLGFEVQHWLDGGHVLEGVPDQSNSPHDDLTLLGLVVGGGIRR